MKLQDTDSSNPEVQARIPRLNGSNPSSLARAMANPVMDWIGGILRHSPPFVNSRISGSCVALAEEEGVNVRPSRCMVKRFGQDVCWILF